SKRTGRSGHTAASVRKQPRPLILAARQSRATVQFVDGGSAYSGGHRNMGRMKSEPIRAARGVYAAVATPRVADSIEIDPAALFDYLDAIAQAGVDGIVLFGSTGEFVHFELADRMRVATLAIKRCRVPLLVNVSHSTLDGALDLADCAIEAGAAGLLLMPPYF